MAVSKTLLIPSFVQFFCLFLLFLKWKISLLILSSHHKRQIIKCIQEMSKLPWTLQQNILFWILSSKMTEHVFTPKSFDALSFIFDRPLSPIWHSDLTKTNASFSCLKSMQWLIVWLSRDILVQEIISTFGVTNRQWLSCEHYFVVWKQWNLFTSIFSRQFLQQQGNYKKNWLEGIFSCDLSKKLIDPVSWSSMWVCGTKHLCWGWFFVWQQFTLLNIS